MPLKAKSMKYRRLFKVKRHGKFGKTVLNNGSISKSSKGEWNQVSGRVSVPCWHATSVAKHFQYSQHCDLTFDL